MNQAVLYDQKWIKFLRRTWLFRFIPFADFALAAGSMALGNVNPDSDFDVIVGARAGRIFTARFFCVLAFSLLGWRRKKMHNSTGEARDKICLNHFVTPAAFRLSPPHNAYWKNLYWNLVPVFGSVEAVRAFWNANREWLGEKVVYQDDLRHQHKTSSRLKIFLERFLDYLGGDRLEKFLKKIQVEKIEKSLEADQPGHKPRIIYNDNELEFHQDTARIEILSENL